MSHTLYILPRAQKALKSIPIDAYQSIRDKIFSLSAVPRPHGCVKLSGREGWRIRIGNYRVIYEINDYRRMVTILDIGDRKDIYR